MRHCGWVFNVRRRNYNWPERSLHGLSNQCANFQVKGQGH